MTDTQAIKDRLDIAQIVGEYVQLKKAGANWRANCPFHQEKTPSFMVHPEKQIWHCFGCFPPGALIQTNKGFSEIEKIKVGELVRSHKGEFRKVLRSLYRPYKGTMLEVFTRKSNKPVKLTVDHEVFAIRTKNCTQKSRSTRLCQQRCSQHCPHKFFESYKIEKLPAKQLKAGDYLLYPSSDRICDIKKIKLADYLNREKKNFGRKISDLPNEIEVNEDFLKFVGYWIAEGSNHRAYIRFSLGSHEKKFAADIVALSQKIFGMEAKIHERSGAKSGIEITCCNSNLANIFENLCGKGAANKHVPFGWEYLPLEKQRIILEAIFRGDGHTGRGGVKSRPGYRDIKTISGNLALQLKNILLRLNIIPNYTFSDLKVDKNGVKHRPVHLIHWYEDVQATYADWMEIDGLKYAIYPINRINSYEYRGDVFNLTVEGDHSYLTENFAVGNCGEGGDVFTFIQKIEGFEFPEALKFLADRAGVKLDNFHSEVDKSQRNRILEINAKAAYFFHHFLLEIPGAIRAREYLAQRKLTSQTIEEWQVGFIPDQWDLLTQYLLKKGFGIDDVVLAGLAIKKDNANAATGRGYYDRFRGRIMFPIWDAHNNVVGFTGRVLVETEKSGGKYVNTPQTLVYDKSRVLYGINKAKQDVKAKDLAVLVEGQMDVIACHQAGMKNVIAASGTALTPEQIKLIKRYTNNAAFAFDADAAGQKAAKRGIGAAMENGLNTKIVQIPAGAGKDADECIKQNAQIWFKAVEEAKDVMEWFFAITLNGIDLNNPKQKQNAAETLLTEISRLQFPVERDHWLKKLGESLKVDDAVLREELKVAQKNAARAAHHITPEAPKKELPPVPDRYNLLLENLWALLLKYPKLLSAHWNLLVPDYFTNTNFAALYEAVKRQYNDNNLDIAVIRPKFETTGENQIDVLLLKAENFYSGFQEKEISRDISAILEQVKDFWSRRQRDALSNELKVAQTQGDQAQITRILKKIIDL